MFAGAFNKPNSMLSQTNDGGNFPKMLHSAYIS
jgi:hypothetical protein